MLEHIADARSAPALDVTSGDCAQELIHLPGAIQPHGLLLSLAGQPLCVQQASANCARAFGVDCAELLGRPLSGLFAPHQAQLIERAYANAAERDSDPIAVNIGAGYYSVLLYRLDGLLIVELEPFVEPTRDQSRTLIRVLRNLHNAATLQTLFDVSVDEIRALTGFERVIIYRFEPEGHGTVVAQALGANLPSYDGLTFPASDIPAQARALYRVHWTRAIPDSAYIPVPLVPLLRPDTGQPLDLSGSALRSVSPMHRDYLRHMGVQGSMSVSLLEQGELWGLIICSHSTPLLLAREYRDACALIGQMLSVKIVAIVALQAQRDRDAKVAMLAQRAESDHATRAGLLNELNHRVKNTLATVQAIASLTASNSGSLALFRQSFDARLLALSEAHDALAQAQWLSSELQDLIKQLQRAQGAANRILLTGDRVVLEPRASLTLSMVFHELMANALQHGALSAPGGNITVNAAWNTTTRPYSLTIDWLEAQGPAVAVTAAQGFGFRLIRRSIERELDGSAEVRFAGAGLQWTLTLPWDAPAGDAS